MDYQCYVITETASEELKSEVKNHHESLKVHYSKIIALVKELGASNATLVNHHHVAGFDFAGEVPKGWKLKDGLHLPKKKDQLAKIADVNNQCPHPYRIFKVLDWQSFLIDGVEYHPEIRFIGEFVVLSHPVFGSKEMNSLDLFKNEGLKEVTANDMLRLRKSIK